MHTLETISLSLIIAALGALLLRGHKKSMLLPPGPKGWPFIGNLLDMPTQHIWLTFAQWGDTWGDICSVTVLGQLIIVLNSAKVASEMLNKKGSIYSDRPELPMAGEMVGFKDSLALLRYGKDFHRSRKRFHQTAGTHESAGRFHAYEEEVVHRFLRRALDAPAETLNDNILDTAGAVSLRISYGYTAEREDDPSVLSVEKHMVSFAKATVLGVFPVDVIPSLRLVPSWFPGGGFHKKAADWARDLVKAVDKPFNHIKGQIASGAHIEEGLVPASLEPNMNAEDEYRLKWTATTMGFAGTYTRTAALQAFFLAMSLFPDAQRKAQEEIDAVIGPSRLPTFADRERLPYVNALCKEVVRFHPPVPSGLPHMATEDAMHDGYFIPKGAIVLTNIWSMLRDARVYSNPTHFNPERFIGPGAEKDVTEVAFGFGRRICPGMVPGSNSMFIMAATSLVVFDITKDVHVGTDKGRPSHEKPSICTCDKLHSTFLRRRADLWTMMDAKALEQVTDGNTLLYLKCLVS